MAARKKNNINKRLNLLSKALLRNKAVIFVLKSTKSYSHVININSGKELLVDDHLDTALRNVKHDWSILLVVFCKNGNECYFKSNVINVTAPCYQRDLANIATSKHKELLDTCNDNQSIGLGWIAVPRIYDFPEDQFKHYMGLFEKYNCWEPIEGKLEFLKEKQ